jgi:hypothetical protein
LGEVVDLVVEYPVVEEVLALVGLDQAVLRRERGRGSERECAEQRGGERGGDGKHVDDVGRLEEEQKGCERQAPRERKDSEKSEGGGRERAGARRARKTGEVRVAGRKEWSVAIDASGSDRMRRGMTTLELERLGRRGRRGRRTSGSRWARTMDYQDLGGRARRR